MEVLEREPEKGFVDPSPGLTAQREKSGSVKEFRTEKLFFQPGVPVVWQVQEILLRDLEQIPVCTPDSLGFKVRTPTGHLIAHCSDCYRAGFVTVVPA